MEQVRYFDNAATTYPKPEEVYVQMDKYYREFGVNVGRGQHKLASAASQKVKETRELLLELFHCNHKEVIFTATATEAINLVLKNVIHEGMNVYISPFEHNAVTRTLHHLKQLLNINVFEMPVDCIKWEYDISKLTHMFSLNTPNVMIISHASNVCGFIAPIEQLCLASKNYSCVNVIDMCQTAGLIDVSLNEDIYDYAVFDGHKTLYGPLGIAGVVGKSFSKFNPLIFGGTGIDSMNQNMPETAPERFEAGSQNIMAIAGLNAAIKWILKLGINNVYSVQKRNHKFILDLLSQYSNITVISPMDTNKAVGVVSCVFDNYSSDNIGNILSQNDIAVRTGLHCAPLAHKTLNTFPAGTVRFSVGYFNTEDDFEKLKNVLDMIEENT